MPLWLDMVRTPMAAPETPRLRRMRRTSQALCLSLAVAVFFAGAISRAAGRVGPCLITTLLIATVAYTALYLIGKHRADQAFLKQPGEAE